MATASQPQYTLGQYLAFENHSAEKHEFYNGEIFLMTGGSPTHSQLIGNLYFQLRSALAKERCRAYMESQRVAVNAAGVHTYPDLAVVCGEPQFHEIDTYAITNPRALFEVLSPSTARYDRGAKFDMYRKLASLSDYVLVSQSEMEIDHFSRQADGLFDHSVVRDTESVLALPSVGVSLRLRDVYEDVSFADSDLRPAPVVRIRDPRQD